MKPKAYIFAGLAIFCGLGASYMTSRLLAERTPEEAEKVDILVAKRTLNYGERIVKPEEMFELKPVLKENEPPDAIRDFEALKGKTVKTTRNKGDHITPNNLYDKDTLEIPEGLVAVGLPVNLATTLSGLASLPGSRVNLVLTVRGKELRDSSARVLLQNVLVLAADGRTGREGEMIAPASVVTFALNQDDALRVSLAKELGILSLTLRKLNEPLGPQDTVITGKDIFDGKKTEPKEGPRDVAPPPQVAVKPPAEVRPEAPKVVEPEPARDIRSLTIGNGPQQTQHYYEVLPNGQIREAAPAGPAGSLPPAPVSPGPGDPNVKTSSRNL